MWTKLSADEFDAFCIGPEFTSHSSGSTSSFGQMGSHSDPVRDFCHGIKRDISQFITLRDDGAWDNWHRATVAQARAQDVSEVLDASYKPTNTTEKDLFDEKQKYMYAVLEKTLLTDKGKALVRAHQRKYDAQTIFRELSSYALKSTKAAMDASSLLTYITTSRLGDGKWQGSTQSFILHWQEQVRKYHTLSGNQKLPNELQRTMLENAVHPIQDLRAVKIQAAQHKAHTGSDLSYEQYTSLLLSAAQQHDRQLQKPMSRGPKRNVYEHALDYGESFEDPDPFTIDSSIDAISAYNVSFASKPPSRLTCDQWHRLTDDAKQTWDLLSDDAKAIILTPRTSGSGFGLPSKGPLHPP